MSGAAGGLSPTRTWFLAVTAALGGFLFGFDTIVINGAEQDIQALWRLSGTVHGWVVSSALWGTVFGSLGGGWVSDRWGRKRTLVAVGALFLVSAVWSALATGPWTMIAARFAAGREYDEVVARYTNADGTRRAGWMKAPNGKPTNLTERQWVQARTPAFKRWFGDWENDPANASKAVDANGEPLVVYHGTNATEDAETWNARTRTYDVEHRKFAVFRRDAASGTLGTSSRTVRMSRGRWEARCTPPISPCATRSSSTRRGGRGAQSRSRAASRTRTRSPPTRRRTGMTG